MKLLTITAFYVIVDCLDIIRGEFSISENGQRMFGGEKVSNARHNFVVSIREMRYGTDKHYCGGSLISSNLVLTACHCLFKFVNGGADIVKREPHDLLILAGVKNLDDYKDDPHHQIRQVKKTHPHQSCPILHSTDPYKYDVGVMRVAKPFKLGPHVHPIKMYTQNLQQAIKNTLELVKSKTTCHIFGWGIKQYEPIEIATSVKVGQQMLLPVAMCQRFYCDSSDSKCLHSFSTGKQLCAAGALEGVCNGDSGGPLVCNGMVYGTVSFSGSSNCSIGLPEVYTGLPQIVTLTSKLMPSKAIKVTHSVRRSQMTRRTRRKLRRRLMRH